MRKICNEKHNLFPLKEYNFTPCRRNKKILPQFGTGELEHAIQVVSGFAIRVGDVANDLLVVMGCVRTRQHDAVPVDPGADGVETT